MAGFTGWEAAVLRGIGAPLSQSNLTFLRAWQQAEGGSAAFNPLNTTQPAAGASSYNTVGVRNYRNAQQGVQATIQTLLNGHYGSIVSGLRSSAHPSQLAAAVGASPWGTSGSTIASVLGSSPVTVPAAQAPSVVPSVPSATPKAAKLPQLPDLTPVVLENLSHDYSPSLQLSNLVSQIMGATPSLPQTPRASSSLPSPTRSTKGRGLTSGLLVPGGGWGGSYDPATVLARIGEQLGLKPTSEKRSRKMTSSGLVSDHWTGSKSSYAYDLGGSVTKMDKAARAIAERLGINWNGGPLVATKVLNGLRFQILYRTNVGGNHFNHIHVGVRRE